ncbi:uncharacterized protein LOC106163804 [Lingula anatina]|uniref:Uncharacterized protein LOC106163804 n=1 Tax=Lingula anatina TaxID=7574 RepID=A0A1S3IGE9_LINAN|nr:uncharacterized protein LOC106163804 [Lingula anatina]|eukprot:XP_013396941.1 uncharacterized protein LOC106163804 [Lingula anatina]
MGKLLLFLSLAALCQADRIHVEKKEAEHKTKQTTVDDRVEEFLRLNHYPGGAIAVMKHGKLVHAKGYGTFENGHKIHARSLFPVSSVSKSITAVAILKLVEDGKLDLERTVFGSSGVLHSMTPYLGKFIDPRLTDITVEHLLHHTAGWDETKAPVYDPTMNSLYISLKHNVTNIAKVVGAVGDLVPYHILKFMMNQSLHFTPGTKYQYSNFGYMVLGRIIEEVTDMDYDEYVQENIFTPCGMWKTRLGAPKSRSRGGKSRKSRLHKFHFDEKETIVQTKDGTKKDVHDVISPYTLDSTLGWHSNVYDMMRFLICVDGTGHTQVLKRESIRRMLRRPGLPMPQHVDTWHAAGFTAKLSGQFWQESDDHFNDMILFHGGILQHKTEHSKGGLDDAIVPPAMSFVLLLPDNHHTRLKLLVRNLLGDIRPSEWPSHDLLAADLADSHIKNDNVDMLVKYKMSEHRLKPWANAMKVAGYYPHWMHAYIFRENTNFLGIFKKAVNKTELDYLVDHGLTKQRLRNHLDTYREGGYHYKLVQNYLSTGHDNRLCHLVVVSKKTDDAPHSRISVDESVTSYRGNIQRHVRDSYYPIAQSIETRSDKEIITALYSKKQNPATKLYHDLNSKQLERLSEAMGKKEYTLGYLDTYLHNGEPKFSAIFSKLKVKKWFLENELTIAWIRTDVRKLFQMSFVPDMIVGYEKTGELQFTGYWVKA